MRYGKLLLIVFMAAFLGSAYASGDSFSCPTPTSTPWKFIIAPYGWLPWINGDVTTGSNESHINMTPKDVLPNLDAVLELHMEARKGNWSFMLDPTYLKLSQSVDIGPFGGSADITMKQYIVDFGEYYKFASLAAGGSNNKLDIEGFVGGRYWYINNDLDFNLGLPLPISIPSISVTKKWLDPVVGGRLSYRINDTWFFNLVGDVGGFGLVSHFTWEAKAMGIWQFSRYVGIAGGFRAIGVNYEDGQGSSKFQMDTVTYGPVLGITFVF